MEENNMVKDDAVSPVIGVILMVAITVILAAVIAAFVFGMAGNVNTTKNVAFVAELDGTTNVVITNHGGSDVDKLQSIQATVGGTAYSGTTTDTLMNVGSYLKMAFGTTDRRVLLMGTFDDGSTAVLLDRTF